MKKAQMSLEMIIGLLILLVVAVVVINIFLTQMKKTETFNSFDETLEYNKYKSDCESYCNQFINIGELAYGVQFCTYRLFKEGSTKLMKKGIVDKVELSKEFPITKGYPVCGRRAYQYAGGVGRLRRYPENQGADCASGQRNPSRDGQNPRVLP